MATPAVEQDVPGDASAQDAGLTDAATADTQKPDADTVDAQDADTAAPDVMDTADTLEVDVSPDIPLNCPGGPWCPCTGNDDCDTGKCLETPDGQKCAVTCVDAGCPGGYTCKQVGVQDPISYCVSTKLSLCSPCATHKDCQVLGVTDALCIDYGDVGKFCGGACTSGQDCGDGYVCEAVPSPTGGAPVKQCKAAAGVCGCSAWAKAAGVPTTCAQTNAAGTCKGTRSCEPGGLGPCSAKIPAPETCNNADDDCSEIPDDLPADATCSVDNTAGSCLGKRVCVGGAETCTAKTPAQETCNGADDDCDGQTDEAGCDDANACTMDSCVVGLGCQHTATAAPCDDGDPCTSQSCSPTTGSCVASPQPGSCADGNACTSGDSCGTLPGGGWGCVPGAVIDCSDANPCTIAGCDPASGCTYLPTPATVICYEGPDGTSGVGPCKSGYFQCSAGVLDNVCTGQVLPESSESCDGIDNSCNGLTDEGCQATSVALSFAAAQQAGNAGPLKVQVLLAPDRPAGISQSAAVQVRIAWGSLAWLVKLVSGN